MKVGCFSLWRVVDTWPQETAVLFEFTALHAARQMTPDQKNSPQ